MTPRTPRPRVVVDARMLDTGGIGTYLEELLPRVTARMPECPFTLLGDRDRLTGIASRRQGVEVREWTTPIYSVREQLELRRYAAEDAGVFWSPHFNVPLAWTRALVVTVHDVAHLALPQSSLARSTYAKGMFAAVRRRADTILFDSAFTEAEFQRRVGTPRRSVVCHLGVANHWFQARSGTQPREPYLLYVGNVKPHKNLGRLLQAFARVAPRIPHRLVIAGRMEGMRTIDTSVNALAAALDGRVSITGYVSPQELEQLVAECDALVLPSLYEGFGLPPLEALACGRAVAVSNAASLPEVCGPEAEYFDPLDVEDIASVIELVARRTPDTAGVIDRRRAWARRYDWDRCADVVATELRRASGVT